MVRIRPNRNGGAGLDVRQRGALKGCLDRAVYARLPDPDTAPVLDSVGDRFGRLRPIINPAPALLVYKGQFRAEMMKGQRVHEADVRAAVRSKGHARLEEVAAVFPAHLDADSGLNYTKYLK